MKSNTENKIRLAIARIEKRRAKIVSPERKLTITSVAVKAGIH